MYCVVRSATVVGVEAVPVDVQVYVSSGLPSFHVVGLGDSAVQESRERVWAALKSGGYRLPTGRITVNLAPAPLRKRGTGFDLPIALGILLATGQAGSFDPNSTLVIGELALDGGVTAVRAMVSYALYAKSEGLRLMTAPTSAFEGLIEIAHAAVTTLHQALAPTWKQTVIDATMQNCDDSNLDYADISGQSLAVRAMAIAVTGSHNILMMGPPGTGKTMLARRIPSIMPPLSMQEQLETASIYSVSSAQSTPSARPPFRDPHHSASLVGMIGGGAPVSPGEVSYAHNGVLFLDEMVQFGPACLQALRGPIEDRVVRIVRSDTTLSFPAKFMLVGAVNPCPCGFYGDPIKVCRCAPSAVERYRNRIGGPLIDRFDLVVKVLRSSSASLFMPRNELCSANIREQVVVGRNFAQQRGSVATGDLSKEVLCSPDMLDDTAKKLIEKCAQSFSLSARAIVRILRVARTIADMDECARIEEAHILEAVSYRGD